MEQNSKQKTVNSKSREASLGARSRSERGSGSAPAEQDLASPDRQEPQPQSATQPASPTQNPTSMPPQQGMSSGAKWGIGIGACCCCLIIGIIIFLILGFAGCSLVRGIGGFNWPASPPLDNGTEIPIPSFSNTPTPSK